MNTLSLPFHGSYPVTQGFGTEMTDSILLSEYTSFGLAGHDGVDFALPIGTPVYAADSGKVILAGPGAYGTTIVLLHPWGQSYYGHLSSVSVSLNQEVTKGELIGYSGETGFVTGPHLHFGIRPLNPDMGNGYYGKVDPLPYLPLGHTALQTSALGPTFLSDLSVLSASTSALPWG